MSDIRSRLDPKFAGWAVRIGVLGMISVLFAIAGPFGTYEAGDFGERLLYWMVLIAISLVDAICIKALISKYFARFSFLTRECLVILAMTAVFTAFLQVWTQAAFPGLTVSPPGYLLLASEVLVICAALSVIIYWVPQIARPAEQQESVAQQPRLARRLPHDFSGQILRLTVNGHIVLVVTSQGSFDLRMRFADAVEEIAGLTGYFTHRSHWVNQSAVSHVIMRKGRPVLVMKNQDEVSVSRKYQTNIEAAGLL
ncbi:MAG: LytTR family DNA-binding domain-containing protein [Ascidiaceihabitans sp.]|nr:LytTR family DNA-binding domain-containing protein [Ascidiaceihabitans sp.]